MCYHCILSGFCGPTNATKICNYTLYILFPTNLSITTTFLLSPLPELSCWFFFQQQKKFCRLGLKFRHVFRGMRPHYTIHLQLDLKIYCLYRTWNIVQVGLQNLVENGILVRNQYAYNAAITLYKSCYLCSRFQIAGQHLLHSHTLKIHTLKATPLPAFSILPKNTWLPLFNG